MKKLLLATTVMVATAASAASADPYNNSNDSALTGGYIGVLGGYTSTDTESSVAGFSPDVTGGDYGVFVGYKLDHYLEDSLGINAAIEAHYAWSNADDTEAGVELEKDNEWGVSFRPGISISETINPYGIIGYKQAEFEASAGPFVGEETYDGLELGIGTELVAYGDLGFRVEYAHTWYGEEDGIEPDEDTLRAGVAYHF